MDDNNVDRFLKESCRSYREAKVKNSARRNSLLKKTLGIETERKMASAQMSREEKQLREQLKQIQTGRKSSTLGVHKETKSHDRKAEQKKRMIPSGDVDPYPVTFPDRTPSPIRKTNHEDRGRMHTARRQRRMSKEFEDLHLNTSTGKIIGVKHTNPKLSLPPSLSPAIARRALHSGNTLSSSDDLANDPEVGPSPRRSRKPSGARGHRSGTELNSSPGK